MTQQHDIVTAQMTPHQREKMYRLANVIMDAAVAQGAAQDVRITTVALLRVLAAVLARSEWGREPTNYEHVAGLLPLYVRAAMASNDGSRVIRPFTSLKVD